MKLITIIFGTLSLLVSVLAIHHHEYSSNRSLHLAAHFEDYKVSSKTLVTRNDNDEKNFTFDELFTRQKKIMGETVCCWMASLRSQKFLNNFITPNNAIQAKSINSSLLAEDVQGRVDITRTFDGRELNTEYLFGLFANLENSTSDSNCLIHTEDRLQNAKEKSIRGRMERMTGEEQRKDRCGVAGAISWDKREGSEKIKFDVTTRLKVLGI